MIFQRLFARERDTNRTITASLYEQIVAAARQPAFYSDWGVPDTPLGRFEMISLHMVLAMRRMTEDRALHDLAQEITDHFFIEVDHSLRELGVGDVGVPKRIKRLAKMYYGRAGAYSDALDRQDEPAFVAALSRNVWPEDAAAGDPAALARYGSIAAESLKAQSAELLGSGAIRFPNPTLVDN